MGEQEEQVTKYDRYKILKRNVFATGQGKELMDLMIDIHTNGALFDDDPRKEAYYLGQRDLVLELNHKGE